MTESPLPAHGDDPPARSRWAARAAWVPLVLAGLFALALALRLPRILDAISWNADALAPGLIAERAGDVDPLGLPVGPTVLGDISSASTLWFHLLTEGIPGHRLLWTWAPVLVLLATAALIGWACHRLAGRWAGLLGAGLVLAAGSDALLTFLAPAFRGPTWLSVALLAATLVWWAEHADEPIAPSLALGLMVAVVAGVNLASDPLLGLAGVGPLALAAGWVWLRARAPRTRRVMVLAAGTAVTAGAVALTSSWALHAAGYVTRREHFGGGYLALASPAQALDHAALMGRNLLALAGAPGMGGQAQGLAPLRWALALLVLAALAVALWARFPGRRPAVRGAGAADAGQPGAAGRAVARRLFVTYWAVCAVLVAAGYLASDIPGAGVLLSVPATRYLIPVLLAAVAVLPVIAFGARVAPVRRAAAAVAATALVAGAAVGLARGDIELAQRTELSQQAHRMAAWLDTQGVERGYASYWTAGPLTHHTGLRVLAVRPCVQGGRDTLCPVALNGRFDWYRPSLFESSFVVVDAVRPGDAVPPGAWRGNFGAPAITRRFGDLVVRVYPYDVAYRLAPSWRPYPDERVAERARAAGAAGPSPERAGSAVR